MNTTTRISCLLLAGLAIPAMAQDEGDAPKGAEALMAVLDRDGDGALSQNEIDMAVAVLRRLDRNADGKVTKDEMVAPERRGGPGAQGRGPGGPGQGRGGQRRGPGLPPWDEIDANNDGKVSKEEAPERMQRNFDRLDTNGDGFIDKKEQEALNQRLRGGGQGRPQGRPGEGRPGAGRGRGDAFKALAEKYDKDGDGIITKKEYTRDAERFAAIDRNDDGKLTAEDYEGRRGGGGGMRRPSEGELPKVGDPAPDFELAFAKEKSKSVKLSSFAGERPVALVFGSYT